MTVPTKRNNSLARPSMHLLASFIGFHRHRFFKLLFLVFVYSQSINGETILLKNLDYENPTLQELRQSIKENLKASKTRYLAKTIKPLIYYAYRVKDDDGFFEIMSKTGMDLDTLTSINELSSPHDIYPGQLLEIPNMRGILDSSDLSNSIENKAKLASLHQIPEELIQFDKWHKRFFLPGVRLSRKEKSFVDGTGFLRPLKFGFLSSGFGNRLDPFSKKDTFHGGIDLAAPKGTSVLAAQDGIVEFCGFSGNYGNLIVIKHGLGYETRYGHLSSYSIRAGENLKKGQKIGEVGQTGKATGPHLHFEVIRHSKKQRPMFRRH